MAGPVNSILIHEADDVATAIARLPEGGIARYRARGAVVEMAVTETIPQYHKFAVRDIRKSERVRKYGEVIGRAACDIGKGAHVHVHNLVSPGGKP